MATQAEIAEALTAIQVQLLKALDEIVLAIGNAGNSTPEVDEAVENLKAVAAALDNLNPDVEPPVEPPVGETPDGEVVGV